MKKISILLVVLALASFASAGVLQDAKPAPALTQPIIGELIMPPDPGLDVTYGDTIKYDSGTPSSYYPSVTNYEAYTIFTPLTTFEVQKLQLATYLGTSTSVVTVYLKADSSGYPGATLWSDTLYSPSLVLRNKHIDTTGVYTFTAGTEFWLGWSCAAAPPYILMDGGASASRSVYKSGGAWFLASNDYILRAIGEYAGAIVDVGVDSVYHGGNWFVTNPTSFAPIARVKNYGSGPATFPVGCRIYQEINDSTYTFIDSLALQNVTSLAPNATAVVTFPSRNWNVNGKYIIAVYTYLTGDANPDNNMRPGETQVYTLPAELYYDDGNPDGGFGTGTVGGAFGQKYNPHQAGSYTISSLRIWGSVAGTTASQIQLLPDSSGVPGSTPLWQSNMTLAAGWNSFTPGVTATGSFYVSFVFTNGTTSGYLGTDGWALCGQGWSRTAAGVWSPSPSWNDLCMRPTITGGAGPTYTVITWPRGNFNQIPAAGGIYEWLIDYGKQSGYPAENGQLWTIMTAPGGGTSLVHGPQDVIIRPRLERTRGFRNWRSTDPQGNYIMTVYMGTYPGTVLAQDTTIFVKLPTVLGDWDETLALEPIPETYGLSQNYPNPFNPETAIEYALPEAGEVTLAIYSVDGSLVTTLVDGYRPAGYHSATFNATGLASGVYFYKLTAGDYNARMKMVLVK